MTLTIELTKVCLREKFTPYTKTNQVYYGVDRFEIERFTNDNIDIVLHGGKDEYLSTTIHCEGYIPVIIAEKD